MLFDVSNLLLVALGMNPPVAGLGAKFRGRPVLRQKDFLFQAYPAPKSYVITLEQNIESDQDGKKGFFLRRIKLLNLTKIQTGPKKEMFLCNVRHIKLQNLETERFSF